jgi:hypothetical protein
MMERVDWRLKGDWIKNCNCAFGCPCDFNAKPTQGFCLGLMGMRIEEGHFGDVRLDGLSFFAMLSFPGPLHEGNGTLQAIIDGRADAKQREALFAILSGEHSDPGTLFQICSLIVTKFLDPVFAPIAFEFDLEARRARVSIPGVLETETQPILNPVTGAVHRIAVVVPEGFEHRRGEIASSRIASTGGIKFEVPLGHSTLARVEQTPAGVAS